MSAYGVNVETAGEADLVSALKEMAQTWSKGPGAHDLNEGIEYGKIRAALEQRFGKKYYIAQLPHSSDYAVHVAD